MRESSLPFDTPGDQPLSGQLVVFTGKLASLGRREARELVARLGGSASDEVSSRTTMLVIGSQGVGAGRSGEPAEAEKSGKLRRAETLNAETPGKIRLVTEEEFCTLAGMPSPESLKLQYYALKDILGMYPSLREDHLRYLQKWGLVRPVLRTNTDTFFAFQDLVVIRQASAELEQGGPFRAVLRSLVAAREGQLAFDFRLDAQPAKIIRLRRPKAEVAAGPPPDRSQAAPLALPAPTPAEQYFLLGSMLDDGDEGKLEEAAAAYRKALEIDPYLAAALINLANIHYARDELAEAQALYERAIGLEPAFFEAHFNLGNIYHDLGRYQEAQIAYRDALALNADYADAHFYLAVTCEKLGQSQEAKPHWRAYQQLAPDGEWVELAREFSADV